MKQFGLHIAGFLDFALKTMSEIDFPQVYFQNPDNTFTARELMKGILICLIKQLII